MYKLVNGERIKLTDAEIAEAEAKELEWEAKAGERALRALLEKRKTEYGHIEDQLDMIFHHGLDAWKAHIQSVKDSNPKPTV